MCKPLISAEARGAAETDEQSMYPGVNLNELNVVCSAGVSEIKKTENSEQTSGKEIGRAKKINSDTRKERQVQADVQRVTRQDWSGGKERARPKPRTESSNPNKEYETQTGAKGCRGAWTGG